jgi:segregation and condensation protein B
MDKEQISGAIEALIFVSGDPVPLKRLEEVLDASEDDIREAIEALAERYIEFGAGIQVMEVAGGFQLRTRPTFSLQVNAFLERKRKTTLSGPALETLAIIAYKQPITRAEIEIVRGVMVDGVLKSLLDKRLIKVAGVKDVPGRPNLYRTTKRFLEYFGIISLKDLPPIEDIEKTFAVSSGVTDEEPIIEPESEGELDVELDVVSDVVSETVNSSDSQTEENSTEETNPTETEPEMVTNSDLQADEDNIQESQATESKPADATPDDEKTE